MSLSTLKAVTYGVGVGSLFGVCLEKTKVYLPQVVRGQLLLTNWTMFKVFLTASAVGLVATGVLEYLGKTKRVSKSNSLGFGFFKGHGGNIIGGLVLGTGMGISGACPGTVLAQVGAGLESARYVLAGGLAAALVFGYTHKLFSEKSEGKFLQKQDSILIDKWMGRTRMLETSLVIAASLGGAVYFLDKYFPTSEQIKTVIGKSFEYGNDLYATAWNPIYGGAIIGALQIPAVLLMGTHLGASGSYVTLMAHVVKAIHKNHDKSFPYFANFFSFGDYAQVGSVIGVILGSYLSSTLSNSPVPTDPNNTSKLTNFAAGFLLLYGARLAGGCTSGHGISGIAKLSVASMITVCGMFAGGILTANLINKFS